MQLDREQQSGVVIRSFSGGELRINDRVYTGPVLVTTDEVLGDWRPPPLAELSIADLEPLLDRGPELVLLGTGKRQRFPPARLPSDVMRRGVGLEVMDTAAACRTFAVLSNESRRVAAALLLD